MQFNKLKESYFSNSDWFFRPNIQFQFALLRKMVYFSSSINTLKWYTLLIHYFKNKHLLNFTFENNTSGNIFDGKHVATMYRNTQNMVEPNFQLLIKYFFIFYTFIWIGQNQTFQLEKSLSIVLHNEKHEISLGLFC
jgi:hypothetical protein